MNGKNRHPEDFTMFPSVLELPENQGTLSYHLDVTSEHLETVLPKKELMLNAILKILGNV